MTKDVYDYCQKASFAFDFDDGHGREMSCKCPDVSGRIASWLLERKVPRLGMAIVSCRDCYYFLVVVQERKVDDSMVALPRLLMSDKIDYVNH